METGAISARIRRIAQGALANILGQVLNTAGQLAFVPVLLHFWGNQKYGEWLALSAAVAYLTTLDFGMQSYVVNRLTQAYSLHKIEEYNRILNTGLMVNTVVPAAGFLIMLPVLGLSGFDRWLHLQATPASVAIKVALLLSFQAALSITTGLLQGVYRATGEYARGQMLSNGRVFGTLALSLATVFAGGGLYELALVQALIGVAFGLVIFWDIKARRPDMSIGYLHADWRLALAFLGPSLLFFGHQVVGMFSVQGSALMVNSLFGAGVLVVFASLRTMSNLIRQAAATIHLAVWPEFTSLDARQQGDALRKLHLLTAKVVMLVTVCGSVFIAASGERLVEFWTRGRVQYDSTLMIALLAYACVQSHAFVSSVLLSACNRQKEVLFCAAAGTIAGFAAGYVLSGPFGVAGFVFGLAAADAVAYGIGLPWMACRMIGESLRRFFVQVTLRSALLFLSIYVAVELLDPLLRGLSGHLSQLVWTGLATAALGIAAAYVMTLDGRERGRLRSTISALLVR